MNKHPQRNHPRDQAYPRQRLLHAPPQLNTTICGPASGNVNQDNGGADNDNAGDDGWIFVGEALFLPCHTGATPGHGVPILGWLKLSDPALAEYASTSPVQRNNTNTVLCFPGLSEISRTTSSESLKVEAPASDPSSMSSSGIVPVGFVTEDDLEFIGARFPSCEPDMDLVTLVDSQYEDILSQPPQEETWLWLTAQSQWADGSHHLHNPHYASSASTNTTEETEGCED